MTTILVVDDSEVDRRIMGNCLQAIESKVLYATDGLDALRQVEQHAPDLVVTDIQMPVMDGLQLLTHLKQDYPALPVVLVTSKGSESIAADALMRGAASYVPKRSLTRDLPETIIEILKAARDDLGHSILMHCMECNSCSFTIYNDLSLIKTLVSHFQEMLRCLPLGDETERLRVGIALHEALSNAYYHGNLEIGSSIERSDREALATLANERQLQPPYRDRKIAIGISLDREFVRCVVRDEGPGFDTSNLAVTLSPESMESGGRGIILMHTIMDEVSYNDTGNEVTLVKRKVVPTEDDDVHDDDES